jgi:hypothetical protein
MNGYESTKRTRQMARTFFKNISNYGKVVPKGMKTIDSILNAMGQENGLDRGHQGQRQRQNFRLRIGSRNG